jgi:transposase
LNSYRPFDRSSSDREQRLRVVGVDDWAWKKGQTYGTIVVDLERRTVADLLPQRSAEQLDSKGLK